MAKKQTLLPISVLLIVALFRVAAGQAEADSKNITDMRTFSIDHEANTFLMNGKPFRYVSGSFHYFRALPGAWKDRLQTMRAAGLNVLDTYVEWSLHNPKEGEYIWEGIANIEEFLQLAQQAGFYIILRPGPYICAERDNGGLPYWLFRKYPGIRLRTSDANYLKEVALWYAQLMPRLEKYLYGKGGNIIMVQVENEYGIYSACDRQYLNWLRDETEKYVQGNALLFTTDIPQSVERLRCGAIEGVFATTDFGIDKADEMDEIWAKLREVQPTGPLVNSEFYPGWLTHWQEDNQRRNKTVVADVLRKMLQRGANVNFYMFFGGTNFGFTAGANDFGFAGYTADISSYDYDAIMDEAGGTTEKFDLISKVIAEFMPMSLDPLPQPIASKQVAYGPVAMNPIVKLLSKQGLGALVKGTPIQAEICQTFENLDQFSGFVLYETQLPRFELDPSLLTVNNLRDRALVYIDNQLVGSLSRENAIYSLPIAAGLGKHLRILVENQGRINFNVTDDTKGILGNVTLQKRNGNQQILTAWTSYSLPMEASQIEKLLVDYKNEQLPKISNAEISSNGILVKGPVIYQGNFEVKQLGDSYLNNIAWGKGVAYVNGFNLGRYWPLVGPQMTMYVPKEILRVGMNSLVLLELEKAGIMEEIATVQFDDKAQLDGL